MFGSTGKNQSLALGTTVVLALIVALGGNSRRLIVAAETAVQDIAGGNHPAGGKTSSPNTLNPTLFASDPIKGLLCGVGQLPSGLPAEQVLQTQQLACDCIFQLQLASRNKLVSLQAWFVRLQV